MLSLAQIYVPVGGGAALVVAPFFYPPTVHFPVGLNSSFLLLDILNRSANTIVCSPVPQNVIIR